MDFLQRTYLTVGPLTATFLLGLTTLLLLLWYSSRKHSYWKKIGIPYAKPFPFLGAVLESLQKPLHYTEMERFNKFGRVYGYYEGNRPFLSVGDPKLLRSIFVKDFQAFTGRRKFETGHKIADSMMSFLHGEEWKRVRAIVTPTFTTGKIKRMMNIFKECSRTLVQNFREAAATGKPVEAKKLYEAFSMDIIASSAFSTKIDSHNDPENQFVQTAEAVFSYTKHFNWRFVTFALMPKVMKFFGISIFHPEGMKFFADVTLQIIEERKRTGQRRNDFLQLLLDTCKEFEDEGKLDLNEKDDIMENYGKDENSEVFKSTAYTKKTLSQEELIAQSLIFFLAGYHTSSSTLSFVSYLLALNPEKQETLIQELDNVLKENNGELTYEAIQSMKYLDNVISEALRILPPVTRLERLADEDYKLGDTGITVPKGMIVTIPVYVMHRDPEFFPEPEKFEPDRFKAEERAKRDPYTYMPFGHGPRNCIGMRFALVEVKVCLAHVLSNFRLKTCPETKVPLDWYIGQGFLNPKEVTLSLQVRKDTVKAL